MLNKDIVVKTKNELLADIEKNRKWTKTVNADKSSPKFVDFVFDKECEAVVQFYYRLMEQI